MTQTITSMRKKEKRTKEAKRFDRIQNGSKRGLVGPLPDPAGL